MAIVFAPLCRRLSGSMRQSPSVAALTTILIVIVIVILPLTAITSSLIQEAANLYDRIQSGELDFGLYFNQVWDAPNVFVTDGAAMTSAACQNPSLTYMALTARAVDHAVSELKKGNI